MNWPRKTKNELAKEDQSTIFRFLARPSCCQSLKADGQDGASYARSPRNVTDGLGAVGITPTVSPQVFPQRVVKLWQNLVCERALLRSQHLGLCQASLGTETAHQADTSGHEVVTRHELTNSVSPVQFSSAQLSSRSYLHARESPHAPSFPSVVKTEAVKKNCTQKFSSVQGGCTIYKDSRSKFV